MGITERKERDKREMEKLILDAAMKLFLEEGYKNLTIRRLAEQIEYSPATIYLYFKDKNEIFLTLQKMAFQKFYEFQSSGQHIEDPLERLFIQGKAYLQFAVENPGYYELIFFMTEPKEQLKNPENYSSEMDSYEILKKNVKAAINAGKMRSSDVDATSFALWSYVHGMASLVIKRGFLMPKEYLDNLVEKSFEILKISFFKE
jgi:AcrR family transcriptional regulator